MTQAQKLGLELSKTKQRLLELSGLDTLTEEQRTEADTLTGSLPDLETRWRAATAGEADAEKRALEEGPDAEARARQELKAKTKVANYVTAAVEGRSVDGPELEFNQSLGLRGEGQFPMELLAPVEHRATTDSEAATAQRSWLDRLMSDTAAARLGISFESVMPGVASFPVTTAGGSPAMRGRSQVVTDAAWTVGITEMKPKRLGVRAIFNEEDAMRLPGLEDALRRDLANAVVERMDRLVFVGDDTANEDRGDIAGLQTLTVSEVTLTQSNKVKGSNTLAVFAGRVDGLHANGLEDLRVVTSVGANTLWLSTVDSAIDSQTIAAFLRAAGLSWTVRADIDTNTANGDFGAFIAGGRGLQGAGVAAVWNRGVLVRDPYSEAAKGEVALTLSAYWDFNLPRASNFSRLKFAT